MNTKIENISDTRKKIIVSFEPEQVVEQTEKMTKEFVKNAKISGFRPGKAPREMVEKTYANAIKEQVELYSTFLELGGENTSDFDSDNPSEAKICVTMFVDEFYYDVSDRAVDE